MSEQLPLVSSRPLHERLSSFAVGLGVLGVLTVGFAVYMPLHRAHAELAPAFTDLSEKAAALRDELQDTEKALTAVTVERDGFLKRAEEKTQAQVEVGREFERKRAALVSGLGKYMDRGHITVEVLADKVVTGFRASLVQPPHSIDVTRAGVAILCQIGKAVGSGYALEIHAYSSEKSTSPPLAVKYPTSWALSAARAASVATALKESCGVDGSALRTVAHGHFGGDALPTKEADIFRLALVRVVPEKAPGVAPPAAPAPQTAP